MAAEVPEAQDLAYKLALGALHLKYLRLAYNNYIKHESNDERVNVLRHIMQNNGVESTQASAQMLQDAYDGSRVGKLSFEEFCIALSRYLMPESYEISASALFKGFDKRNENTIRIAEGACLLRRLGFNENVVRSFLKNTKGKMRIEKNEILEFVKKYGKSRPSSKGSRKMKNRASNAESQLVAGGQQQ